MINFTLNILLQPFRYEQYNNYPVIDTIRYCKLISKTSNLLNLEKCAQERHITNHKYIATYS